MTRGDVGGRPGTRWTRAELLRAGRQLGRKPTLTDVMPNQRAVYRMFGSLRAYQRALGYVPNSQGRRRRKELLR